MRGVHRDDILIMRVQLELRCDAFGLLSTNPTIANLFQTNALRFLPSLNFLRSLVCPDLMKGSPELMTEALNLHNAVIRKARWTTFGYIIEQVWVYIRCGCTSCGGLGSMEHCFHTLFDASHHYSYANQ